MNAQPVSPSDIFALAMIAPRLKTFLAPTGPFDPSGDWSLAYTIYSLAGGGAGSRAGGLTLRRTVRSDREIQLRLAIERHIPPGFRREIHAEMTCGVDPLSTPSRWSLSARTLAPGGEPVAATVIEKTATVEHGQVRSTDGRSTQQIELPDRWTVNWSLFEAVGRLNRETPPLEFTLLDHFDQVKPGQTLAYAGSHELALDRATRVHAFDQLGCGIVPWTYWTDEAGRLLFVVAGMEAYVLEPGVG